MRINKIQVNNRFKGLEPFSVNIGDNVLIIGDNSSGKSSFVSLIALAVSAARGNISEAIQDGGGFSAVAKDPQGLRFEIETGSVFEDRQSADEKDNVRYILDLVPKGKSKSLDMSSFVIAEELLGNFYKVKIGERKDPLKFLESKGKLHHKVFSDRERTLVDFEPIDTGLSAVANQREGGIPRNALVTRFANNLAMTIFLSPRTRPTLANEFFENYGSSDKYTEVLDQFLGTIEPGYKSLRFGRNMDLFVEYEHAGLIPVHLGSSSLQWALTLFSNIYTSPRIIIIDDFDFGLSPRVTRELARLIQKNKSHQYILTTANSYVASEIPSFPVIALENSKPINIPESAITQWLDDYDEGLTEDDPEPPSLSEVTPSEKGNNQVEAQEELVVAGDGEDEANE